MNILPLVVEPGSKKICSGFIQNVRSHDEKIRKAI
jgi:hypothetical protein